MKIAIGIVLALVVAYFGYMYFTDTAEAPTKVPVTDAILTEAKFGQPVQYSCAEEKVLVVWFADKAAKVALTEDQTFTLEQISEDDENGTKFANEGDQMVLSVKDQSAFLEQNGTTTYAGCRTL